MDHGIIDTTVIIVLDEQWYPDCLRGPDQQGSDRDFERSGQVKGEE